ncbi:unnamed protein product [Peronospora belbahrii]|uniref:Guanylate-binding protein N-terminal domain-containing protein n=1 Tax=Peronospora belbahrii TaxID=622444 RepID=A0AAU9KJ84_9STRA|nr:unnamed protein product [Peronospora belbahrii]
MRFNIGANQKLISSDCFRLLSLVSEVQNDVEVMKPVLCELEVMRLSCSLGMMSSVNTRDFEMEMLESREFDDDFVLFLRKEIFGTNKDQASNDIKVISLFGKQDAVKHELNTLSCWSVEVSNNLKKDDQGIYCVNRQNDEAPGRFLVLFAWIQDFLFQKDRLRDTVTYVLRFLTCLSPDMVCCLSPEDVELVERTVVSMNSNHLDAWKSFSVAFHVKRQEEQKDAVGCKDLPDIRLPVTSSTQNVQLLKGSYPAFMVMEPAPAKKCTESCTEIFDNVNDLANWLRNESRQRNLQVEFDRTKSGQFCNELLQTSGRWPEKKLKEIQDMQARSLETLADTTKEQVQGYIEEQRAMLLGCIDKMFDLDVLFTGAKDEPVYVILRKYLETVQTNRDIWSKIDSATKATLDLPLRLKNQMNGIALVFRDHLVRDPEGNIRESLADYMRELTYVDTKLVASGEGYLVRTLKKLRIVRNEKSELLSERFRDCMVKPLNEARQAWFEAVETACVVAESVLVINWNEEKQKSIRQSCREDEQKVVSEAISNLFHAWREQHSNGLTTTIRPRVRSTMIYCDVQKEQWKPATDQVKVFKLAKNHTESFNTSELGTHRLKPGAKLLRTFTIKNHCVVLVTTSPQGTLVERIDFPIGSYLWFQKEGNVTFTRHFGRVAPLCDFNAHSRVISFVEEGGRALLYRFNDNYSSLEIYKRVELSLRTSLALPVVDVLLLDGFLYATDKNGSIQSINLKNQQTSRAAQIIPGSCILNSTLFAMADNMVLGFMAMRPVKDEPTQRTELCAVASEDFRQVPANFSIALPLHSSGLSVQCFENLMFAVDEKQQKICVVQLEVTVRSESFRIEHSKEHSINGSKTEVDDSEKVDHWLRAFYHTYEKFPVRGLIRGVDDTRATLKLQLVCTSALTKSAEDSCRYFFQVVMRDLRKLNKPLGGMDLAKHLALTTDLNGSMDDVAPRPVRSFLQELITFVPIQICRAEGNSLTVMTNGKASSMGPQSQSLQAVDIARSIRFGLLSPLLESWQGRCVVITSMGKQSTGKSYLLNHLTGTSFAIAGSRCTDGAWMSIRILPKKVLLVVLDFEGLGSFERTEQEDVFLSVLNASISMFTIFRIEMRFDKDIDDLFARFQKGVALIKGDPSLFRGKLYMSVKDVNPNDQKGVLDEFVDKFQKLIGINKDSNFLLDLYTGQLDINCSPPLGTISYYQSLMHAQTFIEDSLCGVGNAGFRSGKTFLNCVRLVLM